MVKTAKPSSYHNGPETHKGHAKERKSCGHCKPKHTEDSHRFHGAGSFCDSHFNPNHRSSRASQWCNWDHPGIEHEERARRINNYKHHGQHQTRRIYRDLWNSFNPQQRKNAMRAGDYSE